MKTRQVDRNNEISNKELDQDAVSGYRSTSQKKRSTAETGKKSSVSPKRKSQPRAGGDSVFFNQPLKDKAQEEERLKNLEKMKEKYMPINFDAIKEHERAFLANAYIKKQQRESELKTKIKTQESTYKLNGPAIQPTKAYLNAKEEYNNMRQQTGPSKKILESMESRERIRKYNEKLRSMNAEEAQKDSVIRDPLKTGSVSTKGESVYGRFGKEWEKKLNQVEDEQRYLEEVKEKGMEYLRHAKTKAAKGEQLGPLGGLGAGAKAASVGDVTRSSKVGTAPEMERQAKEKKIGQEYLKYAKSKGLKKKEEKDVDGVMIGEGGARSNEEKLFMKAKVEKMDNDINMLEAKMKNKLMSKDDIAMEDAYIKGIKAKLLMLDEDAF